MRRRGATGRATTALLGALTLAGATLADERPWTRETIGELVEDVTRRPTTPLTARFRTPRILSFAGYLLATEPDLRSAANAPPRLLTPEGLRSEARFDAVAEEQELLERLAFRDLLTVAIGTWLVQDRPTRYYGEVRLPDEVYGRFLRVASRAPALTSAAFDRRTRVLCLLDAAGLLKEPRFEALRAEIDPHLRRLQWWDDIPPGVVEGALGGVAEVLGVAPPERRRGGPPFRLPPGRLSAKIQGGAIALLLVAAATVIRKRTPTLVGRLRRLSSGNAAPEPAPAASPGARASGPAGPGEGVPDDVATLKAALPTRYGAPRLLGKGGMGAVFAAHDGMLDRAVAVKVMSQAPEENSESGRRFLREARVLAALDHPGIVRIHDVGCAPRPFLTMELLEGEALDLYLKRHPEGVALEEVVELGMGVLAALAYAHAKGVVHRDLKPGNVQRLPDGQLKLLDFGLARLESGEPPLTATGQIAGTAPYISPEQLQGMPATVQSDLYAVGVMLFEAATGSRPFDGKQIYSKVYNPAPPPSCRRPGLPRAFDLVALQALEIDPAERFRDAQAFQRALFDLG